MTSRLIFSLIALTLAATLSHAQGPACETLLVSAGPEAATHWNPYLAGEWWGSSLRARQASALAILAHDETLSAEMRGEAGRKLEYYRAEPTDIPLAAALGSLRAEMRRLDALELAVASFRSSDWDVGIQTAALKQLANEREADAFTIDVLAPLTRGVDLASPSHARLANEAARAIARGLGQSHPARLSVDVPRTDAVDILLHEPIASVGPLGGGKNATLLVTFVNGAGGVFKPMTGEQGYDDPNRSIDWILFPREVSAYDIVENALCRGMNPSRDVFIPPTVETTLVHNGVSYGMGSLQYFEDGFAAMSALPESVRTSAAWRHVEAWARTVDYILGNYDRLPNTKHRAGNPGNLMFKIEADGTVRAALIDNGIGRNAAPGRFDFGIDNCPVRADIPAELKDAIMRFDGETFRREYHDRLPGSGIQDFLERLEAVRNRIRNGP